MTLMNEVEDLKKKKTLAEVSAYSPKPAAHVYTVVVFSHNKSCNSLVVQTMQGFQ